MSPHDPKRLQTGFFLPLIIVGVLDSTTYLRHCVKIELPLIFRKEQTSQTLWPHVVFLLNVWIKHQMKMSMAWREDKKFQAFTLSEQLSKKSKKE